MNTLAIAISMVAVLVAAMVYVGESRRSDFEVARSLHLDLTSGDVAEARRLLGTLRYGTAAEQERVDTGEALTAYFTVLWCFERILSGRRSLLNAKLFGLPDRAVRFLDEAIHWHLIEWRQGLPIAKRALAARLGNAIDDDHSRDAIRGLLAARRLPPLTDERGGSPAAG